MATTPNKKWSRIFLITGLSLFLLLGGLHFWFSRNAARYLESVVYTQSKGSLRLKVRGFSFNYFTGYMEVRNGMLTSLDTVSNAATYNIQLQKLSLHLQSFLPLLFKRQLLLDSMEIHRPQVAIYRWRKDPALERHLEQISLPSELGKLYQSLLDGLDAMELKRISINKGNFVIFNKMEPGIPPVKITGVDFSLKYQGNGSIKRDAYIPGKQSVYLHIPAQAIDLPDGRHRLAFRQIELELFRQRLQLDSCTITSINHPGRKTHFNIFFKQLLLVGVDFDALYRLNKIKADSVYCAAPLFQIRVYPGKRNSDTTNTLDAKEVIQELTGDLDLAYVGVTGAGFDIRINGRKRRQLSNSRRDDFAMLNLQVNPDSSQPISVGQFDMNVRQYQLASEDSSTIFRFDSVQFRNNRVMLRQFSAVTNMQKGAGSERRYLIPYFELEGLDWYTLLLEEKLQARNIYLYNPNIYYRAGYRNSTRKKQSLFEVLHTADSQLNLEKVHVRNGYLHLLPGNGTEIKLNNADLVLQTSALLQARDEAAIKESVEKLDVRNGTLKLGNTTVQLQDLHYNEQKHLQVTDLSINNPQVDATLQGVRLNNIVFDKKNQSVEASGLQWQRARVLLEQMPGKQSKGSEASFVLDGIDGANTTVEYVQGETRMQGFIQKVQALSITKPANSKVAIKGLAIAGGPLQVHTREMQAQTNRFRLDSSGSFYLQALNLQQAKHFDSIQVQIPEAMGSVHLSGLLNGQKHFRQLKLVAPVISIQKHQLADASTNGNALALKVDQLTMEQPKADISIYQEEAIRRIQLQPAKDGRLSVNNLAINGQNITMGALRLLAGPLWVSMPDGTVLGTTQGSTALTATNLQRQMQEGKPIWSGSIDSIRMSQPTPFAWGSKGSRISVSEASGGSFSLPGQQNLSEFLLKNPAAWLRTGSASYRDSSTVLYWETAHYDAARNILSLDTISLQPAVSRIVKMATTPYQTDYTTFNSGPVTITGFDRNLFEKDSAIVASAIEVERPVITVYRDKRPPLRGGIIKPLPVNLVKNVSMPVAIDHIALKDGLVVYTELSERTNEEGIISLTHLNATIGNIRNRNLKQSDSLSLNVNALLLDSAQLSLQFRESYTDSLAGFFMQLRMKPTSLSFLNPVVAPLSSVNIVSGRVDSLYLNALGREHMALGEMHLFYRNLRIKFVQYGENNRSKILLRVMSFIANNFIIRTNNNGRKSLMYQERNRERSFMNYLVKMTFSGIASGVGAKKNKKALRRYQRDLEQLQHREFRNAQKLEKIVQDQ